MELQTAGGAHPDDEKQDKGLAATSEYLRLRREALDDAMVPAPFVTYAAPSNAPGDCDIWSADWRDRLSPDDPYRAGGPGRVAYGTRDVPRGFGLMHAALLKSFSEADS